MICFIALVIARILQHRMENKYCAARILESLSKVCCSHIKENYYLFDYRDEVTDAVGKVLDIDFTKKYMRLGEIKKFLGSSFGSFYYFTVRFLKRSLKPCSKNKKFQGLPTLKRLILLVEIKRFELLTPCLQGRCSPN